ncbi:MAG: HDOD domain-containing protein [Gammaproteobacteria bacterium]|nr:HDOD domain-containing protein [Gammaproteobacteria bacterium]MBU1554691.1 HDOD domain-containing protein [Gammaproteobacteria bacterium]MBU2072032.1 HDOD domain-containing protein [Gammaproteobacteria bacterium]MBU2183453.1 HDOD domain-containing protein [Gammaproteobacteria bacterium]MBU2203363.1 HDOD domain-containing protein [Gammaproteobacteria bacterium]
MSVHHTIEQMLQHKIQHDQLTLPTLPEVALKVRQRSAEQDISLPQMADVISQDPALAARMIKVSNSAFMGRSIKVSTLNQAVTRIGLSQIRNIAIAMALEQVFVSRHKQVQQQLDNLWQNSVQVAAIAAATFSYYTSHVPGTGLNKDVLTLMALIHNIGAMPVLTEAERNEDLLGDPRFLVNLADQLAPQISARILYAWGFAELFVQAALNWRMAKPEQPGPGYTDFIRLAVMAQGNYADANLQQRLLNYYLQCGLIPQTDFMQHPDIQQCYQDVRAIFS